MKHYETLKLVIVFFNEDMITTSTQGVFEGLNDLNPTDHSDWFVS